MNSQTRLNRRLANRFDRWMVVQHYAPSTKQQYARAVRLFIEFLNGKLLTRATQMDVRSFIADLSEKGTSMTQAYAYLTALRMFYDFLSLGGLVAYVVPRVVRMRPIPSKPPRVLSEPEIDKVTEACRTTRERALIELAYATGCRASELRNLRIEDVDLEARTLRVTGKAGRARIVLLGTCAADALRTYLKGRKEGYVFQVDYPFQRGSVALVSGRYWVGKWRDYSGGPKPIQRGKVIGYVNEMSYDQARAEFDRYVRKHTTLIRPEREIPLSYSGLDRIVKKIARRAGLKNLRLHTLRHTFATHLLDHGADVRIIQQLLGHARLESTVIYTQVSTARLVNTFRQCHPRGA
jgi:integrase/recombinase XerD